MRDIWEMRQPNDWIVVPTNGGWNHAGENVMGKGLAKQAAERCADLPRLYGEQCRRYAALEAKMGIHLPMPPWLYPQGRLVLAATKALNPKEPHLSWRNHSTLDYVYETIDSLHLLLRGVPMDEERTRAWKTGRLLVPALGCGNGGLKLEAVKPLLEALRDKHPDRVVLVLPDTDGSVG